MNNVLVIKIGGSINMDTAEILTDIADIAQERPVVVVHGVSERMAQLSTERGIEVQMLHSPGGHSSRYTPPPVRDLFVEAATQVNREIVRELNRRNVMAHGLTGHIIIRAERKTAIRAFIDGRVRVVRDDYTGRITGVDQSMLHEPLRRGEVVVVPPLARSDDGLLNIDGDRAAATIAGAIQADSLVILSNIRGLYRHFPDENSFVDHIRMGNIDEAMSWARGRMKRKILGAQTALESGVGRTIISDGRIQMPVSRALTGEGTVFTA